MSFRLIIGGCARSRLLRWVVAPIVLVIALLWLADWLFPLPLPRADEARVVLAEDGTLYARSTSTALPTPRPTPTNTGMER